jgi:hypothetical protein
MGQNFKVRIAIAYFLGWLLSGWFICFFNYSVVYLLGVRIWGLGIRVHHFKQYCGFNSSII